MGAANQRSIYIITNPRKLLFFPLTSKGKKLLASSFTVCPTRKIRTSSSKATGKRSLLSRLFICLPAMRNANRCHDKKWRSGEGEGVVVVDDRHFYHATQLGSSQLSLLFFFYIQRVVVSTQKKPKPSLFHQMFLSPQSSLRVRMGLLFSQREDKNLSP